MLAVVAAEAPRRPAGAGRLFVRRLRRQRAPSQALWAARDIEKIVLVGTAASRFEVAALPPRRHERTLVVHGEQDDTVPLAAVMDWARPQSLPVTVVPGGGHFFHGQLPLLKSLVVRHLRS